ncbi:hypothetical protein V6R86_06845 [Sphingomonas kaistensis]|uniref:HAD family hydrolase n=1 Tax=Sphingomonas kaistensis TaxID=298708 RepID=A0ABZ2G325_9SPHN
MNQALNAIEMAPMPNFKDQPSMAKGQEIDGQPKAIAFDCYDTLLTITDIRRPFQRLAALAGGQLNPSPMTVPMSLRDVANRNFAESMLEAGILEKLEDDLRLELASVQPLPGALEVLQRLRGWDIDWRSRPTLPSHTLGLCDSGWRPSSTSKCYPSRWAQPSRPPYSTRKRANGSRSHRSADDRKLATKRFRRS